MRILLHRGNGIDYAEVIAEGVLIEDAQTALDLMVTVQYEVGCNRIAIHKEAVTEAFFSLGSGLAGEVLQKFVNYRTKLAIIGDFSSYRSQPLRDFISESNRGRHVFFVSSLMEAAEKLCVAE